METSVDQHPNFELDPLMDGCEITDWNWTRPNSCSLGPNSSGWSKIRQGTWKFWNAVSNLRHPPRISVWSTLGQWTRIKLHEAASTRSIEKDWSSLQLRDYCDSAIYRATNVVVGRWQSAHRSGQADLEWKEIRPHRSITSLHINPSITPHHSITSLHINYNYNRTLSVRHLLKDRQRITMSITFTIHHITPHTTTSLHAFRDYLHFI